MKLQLKGIELEIPDHVKVEVSEDGSKIKVVAPEQEVIEKIVVVEVPGPETIRYVPQPQQPIYTGPFYPNPLAPVPVNPYPTTPWSPSYPIYTCGTTGGVDPNTVQVTTTTGAIPNLTVSSGSSNLTLTNIPFITGLSKGDDFNGCVATN